MAHGFRYSVVKYVVLFSLLPQAGIVSWGIGCGGVGTPAVYASVASAACWIDSQVSCGVIGGWSSIFF